VDSVPPTTVATADPPANGQGWNTGDVTVGLAATDNDGGSGVKEIAYRLTGAQTADTTVSGALASVRITTEGTTTLTYFATDKAGNVEAKKTLVVRIDTTGPALSCSATPGTLWPPNHKLVPVSVACRVDDGGGSGASGFTLLSVTSNEPDDAPGGGDGDTTGDIQGFVIGTADTTGLLRAERAGSGSGRVYTLTYSARDRAGNERTFRAAVRVPHDQG